MVPLVGFEPTPAPSRRAICASLYQFGYRGIIVNWSGRQDSNLRFPLSKSGGDGLTPLHPVILFDFDYDGTRTRKEADPLCATQTCFHPKGAPAVHCQQKHHQRVCRSEYPIPPRSRNIGASRGGRTHTPRRVAGSEPTLVTNYSREANLVSVGGLEPPRGIRPREFSTRAGYQLQHTDMISDASRPTVLSRMPCRGLGHGSNLCGSSCG